MSQTSSLLFRGRVVWTTTNSLHAWLRVLVEEADRSGLSQEAWFAQLTECWRVQSQISDVGCTLDDQWTDDQVAHVVSVATAARQNLPTGTTLMSKNTDAQQVDQLADAFVRLVSGTLPTDPPGGLWFVGRGTEEWDRLPVRKPEAT